MPEAYIIDAVRTPRGIGKVGKGSLAHLHPQVLGATVLKAIKDRNNLKTDEVDDIIWGCATQVDKQGADLGRMSALLAGYDVKASGVTLDRFCGSGITSVSFGAGQIMSGMEDLVVAGGTDMMSFTASLADPTRLPLMDKDNPQLRELHPQSNQGVCADAIATIEGISREATEELAVESQKRATRAIAEGVVDGSAAILMASPEYAKKHGWRPRAKIVTAVNVGDCPTLMLNAPVPAAKKALQRAGLTKNDIDVWEINEAFAVVAEKFIRDLDLPRDKVNINGGAMALGHPIGATGSILIGTALDELERTGGKYALVTMCAAGGMAPAIIIERL